MNRLIDQKINTKESAIIKIKKSASEFQNDIKKRSIALQEDILEWKSIANVKVQDAKELANSTNEEISTILNQYIKDLDEASQQAIEHVEEISSPFGFTFHFFTYEYLSRIGFCLILFFISAYFNACSSALAGWRTPNVRIIGLDGKEIEDVRTLPDLGHDLISYVISKVNGDEYLDFFELPNILVSISGGITAIFVLLHPKRFCILRRLLAIFSILNFLRCITVVVTSLPDASATCHAQFSNPSGDYKHKDIFPAIFYRGLKVLIDPTNHITCGDMIFSGHTTCLMICCMTVHSYLRPSQINGMPNWLCLVIRNAMYFGTALAAMAIISTRLHYTLDVLIAVYLTSRTWTFYHTFLIDTYLSGKASGPLLTIIRWLEAEEVALVDKKAYEKFINRGVLKKIQNFDYTGHIRKKIKVKLL